MAEGRWGSDGPTDYRDEPGGIARSYLRDGGAHGHIIAALQKMSLDSRYSDEQRESAAREVRVYMAFDMASEHSITGVTASSGLINDLPARMCGGEYVPFLSGNESEVEAMALRHIGEFFGRAATWAEATALRDYLR